MKCRFEAQERVRLTAALSAAWCAVLGSGVATGSVAAAGNSATDEVTLEVQCAELTSEEQAAIEARSRTELLARSIDSGALTLRCDATSVSASFTRPSGTVNELSEPHSSEPNARADQLVALVGQLLERAQSQEASVSESLSTSSTETAPAEAPSTPKRAVPTPPRAPDENAAEDTDEPANPSSPDDAPSAAFLLGASFEAWQTEILGTAGGLVGGTVPLGAYVAARASAHWAWGTSQVESVSVSHLLLEGALEARLSPRVLGALGGGVSALYFDSETLLSKGSTTSVSPVAHLALRLVPGAGAPHFTLGPVFRYFVKSREVAVLERTVLQAPVVSVAIELEGRFP
jgi:hypothetical protein